MTDKTHPQSMSLVKQINDKLPLGDKIVVEREVDYLVYFVQGNPINKTRIGKFINRQQLDNALEMLLMFNRLRGE